MITQILIQVPLRTSEKKKKRQIFTFRILIDLFKKEENKSLSLIETFGVIIPIFLQNGLHC
jgi:hypothetical protein